jgi:hypothetical protein
MVKSRTTEHEQTIREFRMGRKGWRSAGAHRFRGRAGGVAAYRGKLPLLGDPGAGHADEDCGR